MRKVTLSLLMVFCLASLIIIADCKTELIAQTMFNNIILDTQTDDTSMAFGVAAGDFNNDNLLDIYLSNTQAENRFFKNNGNWIFEDITQEYGVGFGDTRYIATAWADYDNDHDLDLFIGNNRGLENKLIRNDFSYFTDVSAISEFNNYFSKTYSAAWADFNNDGLLDIFLSYLGSYNDSGPNRLFQNVDGQFIDVSAESGINNWNDSRAVSWCDFDNDFDMDLFVCHGFGTDAQRDVLYENIDGQFTDVTEQVGLTDLYYSECSAWGDYDNDGDFDLFIGTFENEPKKLYRNDDGLFTDVSEQYGLSLIGGKSYNASWIDFDNDADLDLFIGRGPGYNNVLLENINGSFVEVYNDVGFVDDTLCSTVAATWGDFNRDGYLDVYIGNTKGHNYFYQNTGNSNNWLNINLNGWISNRDGIGSRIEVYTDTLVQIRIYGCENGGSSQNSLETEFGLGEFTLVDSVKVTWPSGIIQKIYNIDANQFLEISESQNKTKKPYLLSAEDVPYDQGEKVQLRWIASSLDTNLHSFTHYSIWRAIPDAELSPSVFSNLNSTFRATTQGDSTLYWEWIGEQEAHRVLNYAFTASTLYNATPLNDGTHYFMVSAHTSDPNIFYDSNLVTGFSVDNLSPKPPIELKSELISQAVRLSWKPNEESDLKHYKVYRSLEPQINTGDIEPLITITDTTFIDENLWESNRFYYCITAVDIHENESDKSEEIMVMLTDISNETGLPKELRLFQNYPNPFNPETTIRYNLPKASFVKLSIYNALGQEIKTLIDQYESPGEKSAIWSGKNSNGQMVPSGVYFYKLQVQDNTVIKKMLFLK